MMQIPGYDISERIHTTSNSVIYRGYSKQENCSVVIKPFKKEYPSRKDIAQMKREFEICRSLQIPGVVKPLTLVPFQNAYAFVMEHFSGKPLREFVVRNGMDINIFLHAFIEVVGILDSIHRRNIIHKDIKPDNILVNLETGVIKLVDFKIASILSRERQETIRPDLIEGTPAYMSPEQTGRINRSIDRRSYLYSLGITMYELLTGELPFKSADILGLIHEPSH